MTIQERSFKNKVCPGPLLLATGELRDPACRLSLSPVRSITSATGRGLGSSPRTSTARPFPPGAPVTAAFMPASGTPSHPPITAR
jgi:hypothetical protein